MVSMHGSGGTNRWIGRVVMGSLLVGLSTASSPAEDHGIIKRDGRKIRLIQSDTEFAVTFQDSKQVWTAARRMAASGEAVVADVPGAPHASIKLLRISEPAITRHSLMRQVPAIGEVFSVYHYEHSDTPVISTGTIVLRFREKLSEADRSQFLKEYRLAMIEPVGGLPGVYRVGLVDEGDDEVLRAQALAGDARTVWAQPNFRVPKRLHQTAPLDEHFDMQWHLNNTGQFGGTSDADIDAPEAWLLGAEGQDIVIGMLDDSCDINHEDLRGNYIGVGNDPTLASTAEGFTDPRPKKIGDFHGTPVMGLAVASANTLGTRGVAHLARFTASRGLGSLLTDAQIANAFLFARQQEVDVHINSWGLGFGEPVPSIIEDALETAFFEGRDLDGEDGDDPPRGMVVMFASGNGIFPFFDQGILLSADEDLSTLPTVIGIGASNDHDQIASYSNYGPQIDVLAPGGGDFVGITTTDNDDSRGYVDNGLNMQGVDELGNPELDAAGLYTQSFTGTSAACPIAAGTAALILSINPLLTATDVRLILEHTCDKVSDFDAEYNQITNRSLRYGYGRINARWAVEVAAESVNNGGRTWPERVANVEVSTEQGRLTWVQNGDPLEFRAAQDEEDEDGVDVNLLRTTDEFLILQSDSPFEFIPLDGECYHRTQLGCNNTTPAPLPANVDVLAARCSLTCGTDTVGFCEAGAPQCVGFLQPAGIKYLAVYARSSIGRYSFGVSVSSDGTIVDGGDLPPRASVIGGDGGDGGPTDVGPKVSIQISPMEGVSPLDVEFRGNASSVLEIDDSRTAWDFDIFDGITVDATTRNASHQYIVPPGEAKTFIAKLTMYDVEGNEGTGQTGIRVIGAGTDTGATGGEIDLSLVIGVPGTIGSDIDQGASPLKVELRIDARSLVGTVQNVVWDLGDGSPLTSSLSVLHTYVNLTGVDLRIPVTATVTTVSPGGATNTTVVLRRITVFPGTAPDDDTDFPCEGCGAQGPGGSASTCGVIGFLPLMFCFGSLLWLRRSRF